MSPIAVKPVDPLTPVRSEDATPAAEGVASLSSRPLNG